MMAMKRMAAIVALAGLALTGVGVQAQMGGGMGAGPTVAPGTVLDPAKSLDASVSQIEALWMGAVKAMPADKYSFAPSAGIFAPSQAVKYDTVRTFAQLATHTIQANYRFFAAVGGIKPEGDMKAIGDLKTKDEIVAAMAATFVFAHKAVANVTAANAFESVRGLQSRVTTFAAAMGHAEDEYGQAVEYLRMNAIIPPASVMKEM